MRLIDADALKKHIKRYTSVFAKYDWREICEMLNDAPTVDAIEVVRCKDCEYSKFWYADRYLCNLWSETGIDVFEDCYCFYGKRRKDGKND